MKDMLTIASGFQYSVNIAFDLYNDEKLENYKKELTKELENINLEVYDVRKYGRVKLIFLRERG